MEFINGGLALLSDDDVRFNIGGDFEFTFAVSGDNYLYYIYPYVVAGMPEQFKEKWHFFSWMPGAAGRGFGFAMYGAKAETDEVLVSLLPLEGRKKANLRFYAEAWAGLEKQQRCNAFYTLMELVAGEGLCYVCIETVDEAPSPEGGMFPLTQLEARLNENFFTEESPPDPSQRWFVYRREPKGAGLREDIFVGSASFAPLLNNYYDGDSACYEAFLRCGAQPVFLYFSPGDLDARNELMDLLEEQALGQRGSGAETGVLLGGAMGKRNAYIDLLLFDPQAFWEKAEPLLAACGQEVARTAFCPADGSV